MDRRKLVLTGLTAGAGLVAKSALAQTELPPARPYPQTAPPPGPPPGYPTQPYSQPPSNQPVYSDQPQPYPSAPAYPNSQPAYPNGAGGPTAAQAQTYSREDIVASASDFLGVTAESAGAAVERVFRDNGRPTGYIAGEEVSASFIGGLRYGKGLLYMKNRPTIRVFWQGPSVGFDWGANGSRAFVLCYNLQYPDAIFQRFPGVEGTAYLIGGLGVNYQRANDIVLAPMRAGVGLRLGANVGYLAYSRRRNWVPF
jgi:hypothetical protein